MATKSCKRQALTKITLMQAVDLLQTFDAVLMRMSCRPQRERVRASVRSLKRGREALERKVMVGWAF